MARLNTNVDFGFRIGLICPMLPASDMSDRTRLRVMTYNVHGCVGTDRRLDPGRIAAVIAHYAPDIVAVQELDAGRARSGRVDQAHLLAQALAMQFHFHPAIQVKEEQYGDAILSRHPLRLMHAAVLPTVRAVRQLPRRGALWAAAKYPGGSIQVINTHLGLNGRERLAQVSALFGSDWSRHPACHAPLIVCGDFNAVPGSQTYRALLRRLREVRRCVPSRRRLRTFSTRYPMLRLDHIFISDDIFVRHVEVPRTRLTRLASDHFPLIADLEVG